MREKLGTLLGFILIALCFLCFALSSCKVNRIEQTRLIKCQKTGIIEVLPAQKINVSRETPIK